MYCVKKYKFVIWSRKNSRVKLLTIRNCVCYLDTIMVESLIYRFIRT